MGGGGRVPSGAFVLFCGRVERVVEGEGGLIKSLKSLKLGFLTPGIHGSHESPGRPVFSPITFLSVPHNLFNRRVSMTTGETQSVPLVRSFNR